MVVVQEAESEEGSTNGQNTNFFWNRINDNIREDHLEFFVVTSQSAGFHASDGVPFGAGKSTFAIGTAYRAFALAAGTLHITSNGLVDATPQARKIEIMRDIVQNYVKFTLSDIIKTLREASFRLPALVWDDVQKTAPSYQNIPKRKREQIESLTMARPKLANLILTTPSISDIAKPLRRNISLEVIIPKRGTYELQFLRKHRNFRRPVDDYSHMRYVGHGCFGALPAEIDELYKAVREKAFEEYDCDDEVEEGEAEFNRGNEVTCEHCGYVWLTRSRLRYVSCSSCGRKTRNEEGVGYC